MLSKIIPRIAPHLLIKHNYKDIFGGRNQSIYGTYVPLLSIGFILGGGGGLRVYRPPHFSSFYCFGNVLVLCQEHADIN